MLLFDIIDFMIIYKNIKNNQKYIYKVIDKEPTKKIEIINIKNIKGDDL